MKNKRKNIIIVVCVLVAAAIAVCASVGYYYSRPERTAEKVMTAVFTADETEIQKRRFIQHFFQGLSTRQIANLEGVHQRAVWDSLMWAEKKLKKFYKE